MNRVTYRCIFASLLVGLQSCAHSQAAQQAPPAAARPAEAQPVSSAPSPNAPVTDTTATQEPKLLPPIASHEGEPVQTFMLEHFQIATWVRDSVIDGDIEALREPLRALSEFQYQTVAPGGWMQGISRLQAAARLTAEANSLEAAAAGVATIARVCGQCHREQGHSLPLRDVQVELQTPKSDQVGSRMFRHAWAAERMWDGLMAPSDQSWRAGALALAHAPLKAPKVPKPTPKSFARTLLELRELGVQASTAESVEERANVYGKTIATCAQCHAHTPKQ